MAAKKLLVADDSLTIQKVIRLALSSEGYDIQSVSDGNDALQQIALIRPDVVLIDVSLPGKTAFDVKRAINREVDLQFVRFVLMSSAFEQVDETQAQEVLFHGRLTKPFDPAHLREIIQQVLSTVPAREPDFASFVAPPTEPEAPPAPVFSDYVPDSASLGAPLSVNPPAPEVVQEAHRAAARSESPFNATEEDIRQLTDSTIHMSGLDQPEPESPTQQIVLPTAPSLNAPSAASSEDGWAVQERSLKDFAGLGSRMVPTPAPAAAPPQAPAATKLPSPPPGLPPFFEEEPTLNPEPPHYLAPQTPTRLPIPPMPGLFGRENTSTDDITNPLFSPSAAGHIPSSRVHTTDEVTLATDIAALRHAEQAAGATAQAPATVAGPSQEELEAMVRQQLEAKLEEITRRLLPEVAEKIVRQEIQRLLLEQP